MPLDGTLPRRDRDLAGRRNSSSYEKLVKIFADVRKGFDDQAQRCDEISDNWDAYHCILGGNQVYNGNTEYYVPIVRNAVNARKTRFLNQMFPASGRYIDATSSDGSVPHAQIALLEHYIRRAKMKTEVVAALLRNGDIEGQYNLLVDWGRTERHVISRIKKRPTIKIAGMADAEAPEGEEIDDIEPEAILDAGPTLEVLHDSDVLILPTTADSVDDALHKGGSVTVIRRWTKEQLEEQIEAKEVRRSEAEQLLEMSGKEENWRDDKAWIDGAGVRNKGKTFQVHVTWKVLDVPGEGRRLCKIVYGGYGLILAAKRIEFWNDRCPLLSVPVEKIAGVFKGAPPVTAVMSHQLHANDVANQAADSMTFSMLPIIIADPAKTGSKNLIINLGAIWEIDPASIKFAEFPKLWQDAIPAIQADTALAFQTLGVNPAMLPQQTGRPGAKRNQAEIALEQSVDILTTNEACSVVEEGVLTPSVERMAEYDHQFRDDEVTIRMFGETGAVAKMERVPIFQLGTHYYFTWYGVEQRANAQQLQQQIAFLNVAKGLSQDLAKAGYTLNPAPAIERAAGNIFGWREARQILVDARSNLAMDPEQENALLRQGFRVQVHPLDEDPKHLQAHAADMQANGDENGEHRIHIQNHLNQMQMKAAAAMLRGGQPGAGGGSPAGASPGGAPAPGGQVAGPKLVRGAPGTVHPDQMARAGAPGMPRKM